MQGDGATQGTGTESGNMLDVLRRRVTEEPDNYAAHLELAAFLHRLDATQPDGGTRVPEAETAYRYFKATDIVLRNKSSDQDITSIKPA